VDLPRSFCDQSMKMRRLRASARGASNDKVRMLTREPPRERDVHVQARPSGRLRHAAHRIVAPGTFVQELRAI
jgi:hypothetical protein